MEQLIIFFKKKAVLSIFFIAFLSQFFIFSNFYGILFCNSFLADIATGVLVGLTNTERSSLSLDDLKVNPLLEEAAFLKAQDMAQKGYFAHTSPEGVTPWHWFGKAGYDFSYAGENLAVNFTDSNVLHQAWLNSFGHRKNIINERFTEIGIAQAEGIYRGRKAVFVVQLFGRPKNTLSQQAILSINKENEVQKTTPSVSTSILGEEILKKDVQVDVIQETDLFIYAKDVSVAEIPSEEKQSQFCLASK